MSSEFEKYAVKHCGISSLRLHDFRSVISDYVSPTIIEERQLNVATMDVFSRLDDVGRIVVDRRPEEDDAVHHQAGEYVQLSYIQLTLFQDIGI